MKLKYLSILIFASCTHATQTKTSNNNVVKNVLPTQANDLKPSIDSVYSELFNPSKIPLQSFTKNAQKAFEIKAKYGTTISVAANSFVDSFNNPIQGEIEFQVREVYNIVDFVKGNLTTLHNGKILESGGMLYFNAIQNGQTLSLKENATITVKAPVQKQQKDMSIFESEISEKGINWINPKPIQSNKKNTAIPVIQEIQTLEKLDQSISENEIALATEKKQIAPNNQSMSLIDFSKYKINTFKTDEHQVNIFKVKKLGWANIDRLLSHPNAQPVNLKTIVTNSDNLFVYISMAIPSLNVYLPGYKKADNTYGFSHGDFEQQILPIGVKVYIIASAYKNNEAYFQITPAIIKEKDIIKLELEKTTKDLINKRLSLELN